MEQVDGVTQSIFDGVLCILSAILFDLPSSNSIRFDNFKLFPSESLDRIIVDPSLPIF